MFIAHTVRHLPKQTLVFFCCLFGLGALAQAPVKDGPAMTAPTDPGNAKAPVKPLVYVSVLGGYRAFADEPIASWRDANDLTARIGGWRAYAREAQEPGASASKPTPSMPPNAAPNPAPQPSPVIPSQGHGGHTKP